MQTLWDSDLLTSKKFPLRLLILLPWILCGEFFCASNTPNSVPCLKMPLVPIQVTCSIVCNKCTHPGSPSTINQPPLFPFTAHHDLPTKPFTIYLASVTQATRTDFGVKSKPIIVVQFLIQFLSVFLNACQIWLQNYCNTTIQRS